MSTEQITPRRAPQPPRGDAKLVKYDEYIDRQVESTRRVVKIVDLATSLVVLAAGVLAFLMVVAVVEHWLLPSGFSVAARSILFALLTGGVVYFAVRRLWPLVVRKVNPIYAAHAIESAAASGPSLKNSLINLLLFRQNRSEISDAVYHTLEEQAAQRLSRVPVDAAVDRSLLIRFGYVLVAIVAVAGLYKVFSPKDPVVAARRVLMPWANIVPASRVGISGIEPGFVTVSRGEFVDVSADVRGVGDDDPVLLRYTTHDGQAVDRPVPMKLSPDGLRYESRLPDQQASNSIGVTQDFSYRIEAGDARSLDYEVTVVEAPSILVNGVEYDYPEYTGYVDRKVDERGDIRAIEGTRVTIQARANGQIDQAHVDFDADGRRELPMKASDTDASASFVLELRDDRQTPEHASYVLRFANKEGRPNRDPVKHSIEVDPDYTPEAAILVPQEQSLDVRLDETVAIDVEARDPDFAISDVRLHGEAAGRAVIDEQLLAGKGDRRFNGRFQFMPSAHDLRAGDIVQYWVTADDNRAPTPNVATTEKKQFRIVSPNPAQQPPPDRLAQRDPQKRQQPGQQQPQQGEQQPQDGDGGQESKPGQQQPGAAGGQNQPGDNQQPQDGQQDQQSGDQESNRDAQRSEEPGQGDKESGRQGDSKAGGQNASEQRDGQPQSETQPGQQGGQSDQQPSQGKQNSGDKQTGAGAAGGDPQQGSQPGGTRSDRDKGARPEKGGDQRDGQQSDSNAEQSPISSEGDNDGEAFERIQRHLQRSGELKDGESDAPESDVNGNAQRSAEPGQEDKEAGKQGEKETDTEHQQQDKRTDNQGGEKGPKDDTGKGTGAETTGDDLDSTKEQPEEKAEQSESPGGQQTSTKGPSGAGDEQQSQGAPNSQPEMKPAEKREQSPSQGQQSNKEEPPAGAHGKRESDSQDEEGGDRAGGGEEGGGQKSPREGTGSAGQNQSADEGSGESSEKGAGNTSPNAGKDAVADKKTGQPGGETPGRGSKVRDVEGNKPGGEGGLDNEQAGQGDKETGRQGENEEDSAQDGKQPPSRDAERSADQPDNDASNSPEGQSNANQRGAPTGDGGETGTVAGPPPRIDGTVPDGDEANLEYTRKQTDLVLERLAEQLNRKQVDKDLLERLGWSEQDLQKFVQRWQERKQAAKRNDQSGDAAKRELDEALRSLGLRRGPMQQGPVKDDTLRDLREGYRGPVPMEYQERLRAYNQGVSRARQDGE